MNRKKLTPIVMRVIIFPNTGAYETLKNMKEYIDNRIYHSENQISNLNIQLKIN